MAECEQVVDAAGLALRVGNVYAWALTPTPVGRLGSWKQAFEALTANAFGSESAVVVPQPSLSRIELGDGLEVVLEVAVAPAAVVAGTPIRVAVVEEMGWKKMADADSLAFPSLQASCALRDPFAFAHGVAEKAAAFDSHQVVG